MLYRLGEWIEVYPQEALLIHSSHAKELLLEGFREIKRLQYSRTIKGVKKLKTTRLPFTE